jgi:ribonuclease HII
MPGLSLEKELYRQGIGRIAGVDEAGRGPLAGPVVAAAVILSEELSGAEPWLKHVDDSKRLSSAQRERAAELIYRYAAAVGLAEESPEDIDRMGIGQACISAMLRAVENLAPAPQHLLLDFVPIKTCPYPFQAIVKGDSISYSIAAASIIAKVTRDRYMREAEASFPGYSFARNKGYPTAEHLSKLRTLGPCSIHRHSFAPVRVVVGQTIATFGPQSTRG